LAPWQHRKQEWVRALALSEPDLIVNTGDNLGHRDALQALEYTLEPFLGVRGVYVHGSNDNFGPEFKNPFRHFGGPSGRPARASTLDTQALERYFEDSLG